jgi:hypothetical protein
MKFRIEVICVSEDGAEHFVVLSLRSTRRRVSFICSYPCVKGVRRTARGIK